MAEAKRALLKILLLSLLVLAIVLLIVDSVNKPCVETEKERERVVRVLCSPNANSTLDVYSDNFFCTANGASNEEDLWELEKVNGSKVCVKQASCVSFGLGAFIDWLGENVALGFLGVVIVYSVAATLLVPGSILTLGTAAAFGSTLGVGLGTLVAATSVWLGACIAATVSFLLGRFLLRGWVESQITKYKVMSAVDKAIGEKGFQIVLLLRLSPVVPFSIFNYIMGCTACNLRSYILGTMVGILPGTVAYIFIGATVGSATANMFNENAIDNGSFNITSFSCEKEASSTLTLVIFIVGAIATLGAAAILAKYARKQLRSIIDFEEEGEKK